MSRTLRLGLAAAAATLALMTGAQAGDMSGMYGNTIACNYPDGKVTKVWVAADGSYKVQRPDGTTATGNWVDDGTNVCYNDTNPPPPAGAKAVCSSSALRKVGDSWAVTDPFGGQCTATVVAGH